MGVLEGINLAALLLFLLHSKFNSVCSVVDCDTF